MTRLAELTAATRSDVLPGYILSRPAIREWGDAEEEAVAVYMRRVRQSVESCSADVQLAVIIAGLEKVAAGNFSFGMPDLDAFLKSASALQFVVWLSLRAKHPHLTRELVCTMVTPENEVDVSRVALELWGFLPAAPKKKDRSKRNRSRSIGPESSITSEPSADSATTKLSA
jgi:hypothetical protein